MRPSEELCKGSVPYKIMSVFIVDFDSFLKKYFQLTFLHFAPFIHRKITKVGQTDSTNIPPDAQSSKSGQRPLT